jgi:hypothetical protein
VEIENGKLVRVCHCGRSYVWTAANFWQVLVAYLVESNTCEQHDTLQRAPGTIDQRNTPEIKPKPPCCPELDLNCHKFFNVYLVDQKAPQAAVAETLRMLTGFTAAFKTSFNFLDPNVVSPALFRNMTAANAQALAPKVGLTFQVNPLGEVQTPAKPFDDVLANMLLRPGDTMSAVLTNNQVTPATFSAASAAANAAAISAQVADTQKAVASANTQIQQLSATAAKETDLQAATAQIQQLSATAAKATDLQAANAQILQLTAALQAREATLSILNEQLTTLTARVTVLEKPPAPPAPAPANA